jgi:hypothetical protein
MKRARHVKPEHVVSSEPVTSDHIRSLTLREAKEPETDVHTGNISSSDLVKHVGKGKANAIFKHPYHKEASFPGFSTVYQYHKEVMPSGYVNEHVLAAHSGPDINMSDGRKIRKMVRFDIGRDSNSRSRVWNAHLFHNTNDERHHADHGGMKRWIWKESQHNDEKD